LKVVNAGGTSQAVNVNINGAAKINAIGGVIEMKADHPEDTNSITEPEKIIPISSKLKGLGKKFTRNFPPYSITVLQIETK
jgi:alpha-N-arabinofuranosidase